uniref:Putative secreted protein n=1 Tax=Anopheles marajoara TaxID=58244 RepID=A0A2M4C9W4_9DIPT
MASASTKHPRALISLFVIMLLCTPHLRSGYSLFPVGPKQLIDSGEAPSMSDASSYPPWVLGMVSQIKRLFALFVRGKLRPDLRQTVFLPLQ